MSNVPDNIPNEGVPAGAPTENVPAGVPTEVPAENVPTAQPTARPTAQSKPSQQPLPELFNLADAVRAINSYYEHEFPKLTFNTPQQITDGCIAEFIDTSLSATVASARVRIRNQLTLNNDNGEMMLRVHLSDMSFSRPSVPLGRGK